MALLYKVNHWASSKISVAQNQKLSAWVALPMKSATVVASTANVANTEMNRWPEFVPRWPEHTNKEHFQSYRVSVYVTLLYNCFYINAAFIWSNYVFVLHKLLILSLILVNCDHTLLICSLNLVNCPHFVLFHSLVLIKVLFICAHNLTKISEWKIDHGMN